MDELLLGLLGLTVAAVVVFGVFGGLISIFWLGNVSRRVNDLEIQVRKIERQFTGKPQPTETVSESKPIQEAWPSAPSAEPAPPWEQKPEPAAVSMAESAPEPAPSTAASGPGSEGSRQGR